MVSFKELGFVNIREMFKKAMEGGYAVPAYNFNNLEQIQAIINGCGRSKSPVILQVSKGARDYANATLLPNMGKGAVEMAREQGYDIPVLLRRTRMCSVARISIDGMCQQHRSLVSFHP
ncbi:MAG: class II fructose-bisphosphate aldolase [Deltaproteobacteria bacterium]|nr:class II fructose-bisphosphate aldolase [Deltaproteobacteria bacterium]